MTPLFKDLSLLSAPPHPVQCYTVSEYVNFLTIEHKKSTRSRFFLHRRILVVRFFADRKAKRLECFTTSHPDVPLPDYNLVVRGSSNDIYLESGSTQIILLFLQYDSRHISPYPLKREFMHLNTDETSV